MAVNLSAIQFKNNELDADRAKRRSRKPGLSPQRLELEITESVLLYDTAAALSILNDLKRLGVKVAMDDFGTGYSSLAYLNSFPFDKIKIDKSFIADLNTSAKVERDRQVRHQSRAQPRYDDHGGGRRDARAAHIPAE